MINELPPLELEAGWYERVRQLNNRLLTQQKLPAGRQVLGMASPSDPSWKLGMNILAAQLAHRLSGNDEELVCLSEYFANHLDQAGNWITSITRVESAMKGSGLLYLAEVTGEDRYSTAARLLAQALMLPENRTADGCLPYEPGRNLLLVDALPMICPFLARYGRQFQEPAALELSAHILSQFCLINLDSDTHLPYHGYIAGGPRRLGLHAWGRGVGWFLLGLVETLPELHNSAHFPLLAPAFQNACEVLVSYQRPDGNWSWSILDPYDTRDTSTTALIGYCMQRGMEHGFLGPAYKYCIESALLSLQTATTPDGWVSGSLGECLGLGKYPQNYGPTPWLQGAAAALAVICLHQKALSHL